MRGFARAVELGCGMVECDIRRAADGELVAADMPDDAFEHWLETAGTEAVTWEHPLLTEARIAALHAHDFRVFAWTVDEPEAMRRLASWGVDGIISNRPEVLDEVMR